MTKIFVYGSLKRGGQLHELLSDQQWVGIAVTAPQYRLYHLGAYPGLVETGSGKSIRGELYRVDAACLHRLDDAEGVGEGLYERRRIALDAACGADTADAWFYLGTLSEAVDCGAEWQVTSLDDAG